MVAPELYKAYKEFRQKYRNLRARNAFLYAKSEMMGPEYEFDDDHAPAKCSFEQDGFVVRLTLEPDYDHGGYVDTWDDIGGFSSTPWKDGESICIACPSGVGDRDTIYRSDYREFDSDRLLTWFRLPDHLNGLYKYYLDDPGTSKGEAYRLYRKAIKDAVQRAADFFTHDRGFYVVKATASLEGVEMGSSAVWGIELTWEDSANGPHIQDVAADVVHEALHEANETLLGIQKARGLVPAQAELPFKDPLSAEGLEDKYGWWGSHPDHTVEEWQNEVTGNETRQSYWKWVSNILRGMEEDNDE